LGVSQSALSQAIKALEERLRIRLLTRTTRSVSPTPAGDRLLQAIGNRFDEIEAELDALTELRDKPAGSVRITSGDHVLRTILLPRLLPLMHRYPDIDIEFDVSYGLRDIVADRFDAGVRLGESIDKDMIALPIGPKLRMAAVASPAYFSSHPMPKVPQDLTRHNCINIRFPTGGGLYVWEFEKRGRQLNVRVEGQATFNTSPHIVLAALDGLGVAFLPEEEFAPHLEEGRLVRVLQDWCPAFSGYHLYYPSRKQQSPAFALVIEALRL
jgi:DNA-binding transcriptional LysR family regulator